MGSKAVGENLVFYDPTGRGGAIAVRSVRLFTCTCFCAMRTETGTTNFGVQ